MDAPWRVEAITYRLSSKGKKESEKKKKKQGHTGESSTTQTAFWKSIEYSIEKQEKNVLVARSKNHLAAFHT